MADSNELLEASSAERDTRADSEAGFEEYGSSIGQVLGKLVWSKTLPLQAEDVDKCLAE